MGKYSDYTPMKNDDHILQEFPGLSAEDLEQVNSFFEPYLFFENVKGGRRVWTSCCHHDGEIWEELPRTETPQHREVMALKHNDECECPYCHKKVTVKNVKQMGRGRKLEQFIPVLFLHTSQDGETVYAQGYWAWKGYKDKERWSKPPFYMVTRVYRFRQGEWLAWGNNYVFSKNDYCMCREDGQWINEPFIKGGGLWFSYCGHRVVGLERLSNSFMRYTGIQARFEGKDLCERVVSTLALAALHTKDVEMLLKAGMERPINDWVYGRKKNAKVIKWGEEDPRITFGLNGKELKEFFASSKDLDVLEIYKTLRRRDRNITIGEVDRLADEMGLPVLKDVVKVMKQIPYLKLKRLARYFARFSGPCCGGLGIRRIADIARTWMDYIVFAEELGYDLKNPLVCTPRELDLKHLEAYQVLETLNVENERVCQAINNQKEKIGTQNRVKALEKKYGFESEQYFIRAPESAAEIVEEGKALSHCVGGYAGRHARGVVTILFLRKKSRPRTPLCTIEMNGTKLVQVHGYGDDRHPCAENPTLIPPIDLYAEILTPWLAWVKAGSPRTKDGRPKLPKKKKEDKAA